MQKENIPFLLGFIVIIVIILATFLIKQECREQGGTPVGYGDMDCWDNVNKTFIK